MNIKDFNKFYKDTTKNSINYEDMKQYGCVHIDKRRLKVNYRYNIINLLDEIIKEGEYNAEKNL